MSDSYNNNNYQIIEKEINESEIKLEDFINFIFRRRKLIICSSLLIFCELTELIHDAIFFSSFNTVVIIEIDDIINSILSNLVINYFKYKYN